jgi:superfamily II DNA or RNA helicase
MTTEIQLVKDFCEKFNYYKYTKLSPKTKRLFLEVVSKVPQNEKTAKVKIYDSTFQDILRRVNGIQCIEDCETKLFPQQLLVIKQMLEQRSLLVFHSTGSGKTLTAVVVSQCLLNDGIVDRVIVVSPKTLIPNFRHTMEHDYGAVNFCNYEFYSYEKFRRQYSKGELGNLENTLLIFDEAHTLKTETGLSKFGIYSAKFGGMALPIRPKGVIHGRLVRKIMEASKTAGKLLLLTATPSMNSPSDIENLIEIMDPKTIHNFNDTHEFFSAPQFDARFFYEVVDNEAFREHFGCKISIYDAVKTTETGYPEVKEEIVSLRMSRVYFEYYMGYYYGEFDIYENDVLFTLLRRRSNGIRIDKEIVSPKRDFIMKKILAHTPTMKTLIYSQFLDRGLRLIERALKRNKISYSIITGEVLESDRKRAVKRFNSGETRVMLISSAASTGLDLKETRMVFLIEPFWNENQLDQAKSRAIRYKSHTNLPKSEQNVEVYTLILDTPEGEEKQSVDRMLYESSKEKQKDINTFLDKLRTYSVEEMGTVECGKPNAVWSTRFFNIGDYTKKPRSKEECMKLSKPEVVYFARREGKKEQLCEKFEKHL